MTRTEETTTTIEPLDVLIVGAGDAGLGGLA